MKFGSPEWQRKYNPRYKKKARSIRIRKNRTGGFNVAKRRSKRSSSRSSGVGMNGLVPQAVGVAAYILYEAMLEPKVAEFVGNGMTLNIVELAAGVYFARKGGVLGSVGKAAVVINMYQLIQPLLANKLG